MELTTFDRRKSEFDFERGLDANETKYGKKREWRNA